MPNQSLELIFKSEADTLSFAESLAPYLEPGDTILLDGPVGAGKSFLSRALIRSVLGHQEDVPSPTFTLVQTYETDKGEIWHCDLYRITNIGEIDERGLFEAFETAICLVEWPDRLADEAPSDAITIALTMDEKAGEERRVFLSGLTAKWHKRLNEFLDDNT